MTSAQKRSSIPVFLKNGNPAYTVLEQAKRSKVSDQFAYENQNLIAENEDDETPHHLAIEGNNSRKSSSASMRSTDGALLDPEEELVKRVGTASKDRRAAVITKMVDGSAKYSVQGQQENASQQYLFPKKGLSSGLRGYSVRRQEVIRKSSAGKYNKPPPSTPGRMDQRHLMEQNSSRDDESGQLPNNVTDQREAGIPTTKPMPFTVPQGVHAANGSSRGDIPTSIQSSHRRSRSHETITLGSVLPGVDEEALIMSTCSDVGVEPTSELRRNCQKFPLHLAESNKNNFARDATRRSERTPSSNNSSRRNINLFRNQSFLPPTHKTLLFKKELLPPTRSVPQASELVKPKIGSARLKFDTLSKTTPAQTALFRGLHREEMKGEDGGDKKWNRKYSLPRHHQRPRPSDRPASDTEGGGSGGSQAASPEGGGDRVQGWAASFERLLEDPAGLHTFAEFLRKEYSHENIFFWTACERYRQGISSSSDSSSSGGGAAKEQPSSGGSSPRPWGQWLGRHAAAAAIYNTHLGANAPEPVNVDSQARQVAQESLHEPSVDLFAAAQKQVFNLMKFDSYSRFLKSALYQECVERETRGDGLQFTGEDDLDPSLRIHDHSQQQTQRQLAETAAVVNNNNFVKGKGELEERRRRSLLPWARHKDRSKSKDRLNTTSDVTKRGTASSISKAKGLSSSAGRLPRGSNDNGGASAPARSNSSSRTSGRHPSDSSGSLGRASEVSGSRTSLNSGSDGILLMGGRKAISKESLTSSECLSLSGGEGGSGGVTGRCRVVLPDRSQSVVAVRSGVTVERVMRRLLDRRGLPFLAFNVLHAKSDKLVAGVEDSSALCGAEVRLQRLVLFRLDLPNQKTVCVKAKPHKVASDVLRPILAKYGFKLDLMHIHTIDDPRPINVKGPITDLDGQKFIIQTKEDVKEWGVAGSGPCCSGSPSDADALDAITNRVFEDLLHSKTSHQLLNSCDYDARSTKTDQGSEHSSGVRGGASRHTLLPQKSGGGGDGARGALNSGVVAGSRVTSIAPCKDNDELYEGLKRAQMSRIEDQRGTKINSELPDFLKCDSENKENLVEMEGDEDLAKCFPEVASFLAGGGPVSSAASAHYYGSQPPSQQHNPTQQHPHHHHYHCQSASSHHHHHHLHTSQQQAPPLRPEEMSQQPYIPHSSGSAATTSSSITMQQHSSSSLAQHQAHNFWSDISGGGSSIPSSLLATSSSSLSSSTGLPMSSTSFGNFDAIDTPLAVASSLLDMHYSDTIVPKLRPRPESCVNTRSDGLSRPEQANRPKSSCGSLTAANSTHSSPDRTLLASPDLDETLSSTPQADRAQGRYNIRGAFSNGGTEDSHRHTTRAPSPSSHPHHLHHVLHHRHHHVHLHQSAAALDSIASSSVGNNSSTSLSHTNINHTGSNVLNFSASTNHLNSVFGSRNCSSTNPLSFITRPMNTPSNTSNYTIGGGGSYFSTPPPPLPPKPKLGGPPRGPPPRPPSRQLPPALPSHPPPAGDANEAAEASAPTAEADAISFV